MADESLLQRLIDEARDGDEAAREELFRKCRNYVSVVARTHVESWLQAKVDASDLVQQSLMDAHAGFDGFRGETEGEWMAWLRRIVRHNAVDYVRRYHGAEKRRAGKEVALDARAADDSLAGRVDPSDPGESPSQHLLRLEREIELADAISRLSDDHQEVILLRNLQRLPFDEVAERMGRTRPAVQMLWTRALKKLRALLDEPVT